MNNFESGKYLNKERCVYKSIVHHVLLLIISFRVQGPEVIDGRFTKGTVAKFTFVNQVCNKFNSMNFNIIYVDV